MLRGSLVAGAATGLEAGNLLLGRVQRVEQTWERVVGGDDQ